MSVSTKEIQYFAPPIIEGALANIPDGQENLLPIQQLAYPLSITIVEAPIEPAPPPGRPVELRALVGLRGTALAYAGSHFTTTPVQLPIASEIHQNYFDAEGIYEVRVQVIFGGSPSDSNPAFFTVDKTPPNYGSPAASPVVPDEVIRDGITTDYLDKNQDKVIIYIRQYLDQRPGDVIELYFGSFDDPVSTAKVNDATSDTPIELKGDVARKLGNGNWPVFYTLKDRAGNVSTQSRSKTISVKLT